MNKIPMIIDVDTGCDDAIEIILASLQSNLDIKGITCVAGNTSVEHVFQNTIDILDYIHSNIHVYKGASKPLIREWESDGFHGENGLGDVILPHINEEMKDAFDFMYQTIVREKEMILLCSAP